MECDLDQSPARAARGKSLLLGRRDDVERVGRDVDKRFLSQAVVDNEERGGNAEVPLGVVEGEVVGCYRSQLTQSNNVVMAN